MDKDAEFLKRLLATFKVEAEEHLKGITSGIIELEKSEAPEGQAELIEAIFREAHSLKGAARAVDLEDIEALCQAMESVFAAFKKKETEPSAGLFDLLQQALDFLGRIVPLADMERSPEEKALQSELIRRLTEWGMQSAECGVRSDREITEEIAEHGTHEGPEKEEPTEMTPEPGSTDSIPHSALRTPHSPLQTETVRVSTAKLSAVLLQSEEMLSAKLSAKQRAFDLRGASAAFGVWKKEWAKIHPLMQEIRPVTPQVPSSSGIAGNGGNHRSLAKVVDFLEWNSDFVKSLENRYVAEARAAERDGRALGGMVSNLLDDMKKVLMFPFSSLLEILPKIVRDLARDSGKNVELTVRGGELEIDRRILEEMKDPLVHLVRNCIDHGVEKPDERQAKNKPRSGMIMVTVSPRDNKVELVVADDGAGISPARVRAAMVKLGTVPREKLEELTDKELLPYVFQSGVSTSPIITELSGRGLGLAIVREKVEKLGGTISLETDSDAGTVFRIILPLTVATFRGILVRLGEQLFVLPTMYVERAVRLKRGEIKTVENRETIQLNAQTLSLARLRDVLGLAPAKQGGDPPDFMQAIVLTATGTSIAFLVDEVLGEQEVLAKGLGRQLSRVRTVAGATVLGSGQVVPIMNVPDLLKLAVRVAAPAAAPGAQVETAEAGAERYSVMVVEDSITTRTLLKNILETVGYDVVTAVDGIDAFTKLKSTSYDIVVSDVDMPRMNGFDLTARIRADKGLGDLPVVLVTALASREDRERGIDVGANAYIVKSSFDQSNLLEVMKRLL